MSTIHTPAEARVILSFIERALDRSDESGGSIGYVIQVELDTLCKETGVEQTFDRVPPAWTDEGLGYAGRDWEMVQL